MKSLALLACGFLGSCTVHLTGLLPVSPPPDARVESVQPTLRWEPLPSKEDPHVSEVVYDLRILRWDGFPVYECEGLAAPEHSLVSPLEPEERYLWTVRARFRWDGERRVTQWSGYSDPTERSELLQRPSLRYLTLRTPSPP